VPAAIATFVYVWWFLGGTNKDIEKVGGQDIESR